MDKSEPVPNFALILSWNVRSAPDESNTIVLVPAPALEVRVKLLPLFTVTLPPNVEIPAIETPPWFCIVTPLPTVSLVVPVISPTTSIPAEKFVLPGISTTPLLCILSL